MPLNRQSVLADIRATNPELYDNWDDDLILGTLTEVIPEINFEPETEGAAHYRAYGSEVAPGFGERALHQLENQWTDMKSGLYGMMPTGVEAAESYRKYNQNLYKQKIADNTELQALTAWKEDEPGWSGPDTYMRSLSEALPSLALAMTGGVVAWGGGAIAGVGAFGANALGLLPMFAMEAGGQYNEAMSTLVDDLGMEPEEARGYARMTSVAYGTVASLLEKIGANHYLKMVGIGKKTAEGELRKSLAKKIVQSGMDENALIRLGARGLAGAAKTIEGSLLEGTTEFMQAYTQNTINAAMRLGFGEDEITAGTALEKAFKETWKNPAVWEEGFAGATTGILGFPAGVTTSTQASKVSTEDIAKKQKEYEDSQEERETVSGASATEYFSAIVSGDVESMSSIMEKVSQDKGGLAQRIDFAQENINLIGKKILSVIGNNVDIANELLEHPDSKVRDVLIGEVKAAMIEDGFLTEDSGVDDVKKVLSAFVKGGSFEQQDGPQTDDIAPGEALDPRMVLQQDILDEMKDDLGFLDSKEDDTPKLKTVAELDESVSPERRRELVDENKGIQEGLFGEDGGVTSKVSADDKKKALATWKESLSEEEKQWIDAWEYVNTQDVKQGQQQSGEDATLLTGLDERIKEVDDIINKKNAEISQQSSASINDPKGEYKKGQRVQLNIDPSEISNKNNRESLEKLNKDKEYAVIAVSDKSIRLIEVNEDGDLVVAPKDQKSKDQLWIHKELYKGKVRETGHLKILGTGGKVLKPDPKNIQKNKDPNPNKGDAIIVGGKVVSMEADPKYGDWADEKIEKELASLGTQRERIVKADGDLTGVDAQIERLTTELERREEPANELSDDLSSEIEVQEDREVELLRKYFPDNDGDYGPDTVEFIEEVDTGEKWEAGGWSFGTHKVTDKAREVLTPQELAEMEAAALKMNKTEARAKARMEAETKGDTETKKFDYSSPADAMEIEEEFWKTGDATLDDLSIDELKELSKTVSDMPTSDDFSKAIDSKISEKDELTSGTLVEEETQTPLDYVDTSKKITKLKDLSVKELKTILKENGMSRQGNKEVLMQRIEEEGEEAGTVAMLRAASLRDDASREKQGVSETRFEESKRLSAEEKELRSSVRMTDELKSQLDALGEDLNLPSLQRRRAAVQLLRKEKSSNVAVDKLLNVLRKPKKEEGEESDALTKEEESFIEKYEDNEAKLDFSGALEEENNVEAAKLAKEAGYKKPTGEETANYERLKEQQKSLAKPISTTKAKPNISKKQASKIKGLITSDKEEQKQETTETESDTPIVSDTQSDTMSESDTQLDDADFQDAQDSNEKLISEDRALADEILKRLQKHFPHVDIKTFEGVIKIYGREKIGYATEALVAWSSTDGRLDTLPHEFAHIYVKLLRNEAIIKRALKQFKTEEKLVQAIADYYMDRIRNKSWAARIKRVLKQMVARLKRWFGVEPQKKDEVLKFIAEEFYKGRWLGIDVAVGEDWIEWMDKTPSTEMDEEGQSEETSDAPETKQTSIPTGIQVSHFMHDVLGVYINRKRHYPEIMELASQSETYEEYEEALFEWAKEMVEERNMKGDENLTPREILLDSKNAWMKNQLKQEWSRIQARIPRFDIKAKHTGRNSRIYLHVIENFNEEDNVENDSRGMELASSYDRVNERQFPEFLVRNFIEDDYLNDEHNSKLMILPLKQIMKRRAINKRGDDGKLLKDKDGGPIFDKAFYVSSAREIDIGFIKTQQKQSMRNYRRSVKSQLNKIKAEARKMVKDGVTSSEVQKYIIERLEKYNPKLLTIIGSKLGDNSSMVATNTHITPDKLTPKLFNDVIEEELANNNIREEHAAILRRDGKYDKFKNSKNKLVQSESLVQYLEDFISDSKSENPINDFFDAYMKDMDNVMYDFADMSQALAQLKFWQDIRTPDYFMYEKSAGDSMIRLSINMAEGPSPIEAGDMNMMVIDDDVKIGGMVWERDANGNYVYDKDGKHKFVEEEINEESMTYGDMDGASLTGTQYLSKVGGSMGYNVLQQIKTFIRQRDVNEDGSVDYIGMKHMQFAAYKGMKFYKDNRMIAQVKTRKNGLTYFEDNKGNEFDMIASPNEAKMTFGKYASEQQKIDAFGKGTHDNGYYKVHKIRASSIKVTQVLDKSKMSASHPIALGELLLSLGYGNKEVNDVLKQIRGRYVDVANHYTTQIKEFYERPDKLAKFVKKMARDGEVPDELQKYIKLIDENGYGVFHPAIITHILPTVNSKLIKDGINKVRAWDGSSTILYIKPSRNNVKSGNSHLKDGNIILSADNKVSRRRIKKLIDDQMGGKHMLDWQNMSNHEEIKTINEYLEKHDVHILMHRNPIAKVTGPVVRRIQALEEGLGETTVMTEEDVKSVLDGDWDGDKLAVEFVSGEHADAMLKWQNSELFANVDNVVSLLPFGQRIDKAARDEESATSALSRDDVNREIYRNSKNDGSTGVMMNGRTIMAQLHSKEFKVVIGSGEDSYTITASDPNQEVVMDYIDIQPEQLTSEELGIIYNNGKDTIQTSEGETIEITKKGETYTIGNQTKKDGESWFMKTTKGHEMAILFQMAVDGSKFPFLGEIVGSKHKMSTFEFMLSRIFERSDDVGLDNKKVPGISADLAFLGKIYASQNLSRQRGGRTRSGISTDFATNIAMSKDLDALHNDKRLEDDVMREADVEGTRTDDDFSKRFTAKVAEEIAQDDWKDQYGWGYSGHKPQDVEISMKNRITPMESLLLMLGSKIEDGKLHSLVTDKEAQEDAHIYAMAELMNLEMIQELMNEASNEEYTDKGGLGEYTQAYKLLYNTDITSHLPETEEIKHIVEKYLEKTPDKALNLVNVWDILMEHNKDKAAVRADTNNAYIDFTDLFIDKWMSLSDKAQAWATIQFLTGNGASVHVLKLLPMDLMSENIIKNFMPVYEQKLRDIIEYKKLPDVDKKKVASKFFAEGKTPQAKRKEASPYKDARAFAKATKTNLSGQHEKANKKMCKAI